MNKKFTKYFLFFLGIASSLAPFGVFQIVAHNQTHVYSKTYFAALVDKVDHLASHKDDKKIVLIGGSNVAFGFNSELIEKEFPEYKVVNFGLYAQLGTKLMMDLALDYIGKDDIAIIIPEINSESMSLYFNSESTLKALEDRMDLASNLEKENKQQLIGSYFKFVSDRSKINDVIEPTGVYQRQNFNEYGDIVYEEKDENDVLYRQLNRMKLHFDPTMLIDYSMSLDQSFIDYLNEYNEEVKRKEARCLYAFCPVNNKANISDENEINDFYWSIRKSLSLDVIGNPKDYVLSPHYFFDSNFHLNEAGSIYRTRLFIEDLSRDYFHTIWFPTFDIPLEPEYAEGKDVGPDSETASYFEYSEYEDCLVISGVSDKHVDDTEFVLPKVANQKEVVGIAKDAFKDCTAIKSIDIDTNIAILMDGCFGNCPSLESVKLITTDPNDIIVSYTGGMVENVSTNFKIYIHDENFTDFSTDYYWGAYTKYFARY